VKNGLFPSRPPYGYRNVRIEGRSLPEVDPEHSPKITRIFELYAYNSHTIDSLQQTLCDEGIWYTSGQRRFPRSKLHQILRDRSYIGEIRYHGQWYPGLHQPLVSRSTFSRVQVLLGDKVYHNHELTYAGGLVECSYCGRPISGEQKTKKTRRGEREYVYYRCARYNRSGHPRVRVTEKELDCQVLAIFDSIRIQDPKKRDWILRVLRERTRGEQATAQERLSELRRQLTNVAQQQDRLLNLYLLEEIDGDTHARKSAELRDRAAELKLRLEAADRGRHEEADIAAKVFELSQSLRDKWVKADYIAKRRILEILCLNLTLVGATLVPEMRKPFAILAEGLNSTDSRGD
jgi:hypothetical protein